MSSSVSEDLAELYQAVILDHNKHPRNFGRIDDVTCGHEGFNPICGDRLFVYVKMRPDGETIEKISFEGEGCAISKASASMMTTFLKGKTIHEAMVIFTEFHNLLMKKIDPDQENLHLGKLKVFAGVWQFPTRIKCASLPWHTLKAALEGDPDITVTE